MTFFALFYSDLEFPVIFCISHAPNFSKSLLKWSSNSWKINSLFQYMTNLLKYYNGIHQFNNWLIVLLKYINLFLMIFEKSTT